MTICTATYSLSRTDPLGDVFPLDQSKLAMQTAIYHVVEMELEFALLGVNVGQFGIVPQEWIVKVRHPCVRLCESARERVGGDTSMEGMVKPIKLRCL